MSGPAAGGDGKQGLLDGIGEDAAAEAESLLREAREAASERERAALTQAATLLEDARSKSRIAVQAIERQAQQATGVEARRISLRVREQVSRRVLEETALRLERMTREPGYRNVLKGWIVEAALGLDAAVAQVLASAPEMSLIDDKLLAEASAEAGRLAGTAVRLERSKARPADHQGVLLTSRDGRTAFNNQVPTRLDRKRAQIRKLIYAALRDGPASE